MSGLRHRQIPKRDPDPSPSDTEDENEVEVEDLETEDDNEDEDEEEEEEEEEELSTGISIVDILRVFVTLIVASCGLSFYMTSSESLIWGYKPWFTRWPVLMRYIVRYRDYYYYIALSITYHSFFTDPSSPYRQKTDNKPPRKVP